MNSRLKGIIKVQFQKYSELKDGKTELEDKIKKLQVIIKEQENKKIARFG